MTTTQQSHIWKSKKTERYLRLISFLDTQCRVTWLSEETDDIDIASRYYDIPMKAEQALRITRDYYRVAVVLTTTITEKPVSPLPLGGEVVKEVK